MVRPPLRNTDPVMTLPVLHAQLPPALRVRSPVVARFKALAGIPAERCAGVGRTALGNPCSSREAQRNHVDQEQKYRRTAKCIGRVR